MTAAAHHCARTLGAMEQGPRSMVVEVDGVQVRLLTVGALAAAVNRTSATIRFWERRGLIPRAPYVLETEDPRAKRRLYPPEIVEAVRRVALQECFGRRRPSDRFLRQQERLCDAWRAALPDQPGPPRALAPKRTDGLGGSGLATRHRRAVGPSA